MRYFIELSYKGTAYNGWQRQDNAPSVQQLLEDSFTRLLRENTAVTGAGRTDTGVHASYYVAHFDCGIPIADMQDFIYHLNSILPPDIAVYSIVPVQDSAHARFDAVSREYKYYISLVKNPFARETAWIFKARWMRRQ